MMQLKEGYKETEIGIIPDDWKLSNIENFCKTMSGGTPSRSKREFYENGTIPWVKTGELNRKYIYDSEEHITEVALQKSSAKLAAVDSVLLAMYGATIGKSAILKIPATTNQACCIINPDNAISTPEFIYYYLDYDKENLIAKGAGGAQPNISQQIIKQHTVVLPPLDEQQRIAEILSATDEHIEKLDKTIADYELLKKGMMKKLLTEGIGHTEFKETEIGRIPKAWDVKRIEDICDILDSKRKPLNAAERNSMKGDIPYYGANGVVDYINDYLFDEDLILLAEDGGNFSDFANRPIAYRISGKSWVNNHAHILRPYEGNSFVWIFYSLQHKDITDYVQGGTRSKLNQKDLRKILVPVPSLEEQNTYSEMAESIDMRTALFYQEREDFVHLKKALMEQLLTGKIRTTEIASLEA